MRHRFGSCVLDVDRHELRRDGEIVHVEPQVFDVLRYLVDHADRVVPREELLDEIWGSRFVTESALTSRIKAARQAVGDDGERQEVIRTVRGRGFRMVAPVVPDTDGAAPAVERRGAARTSGLVPHVRSAVIGRDADLAKLCVHLETSRLVTVVGPGGVGKTTLAMEAAAAVADRFDLPPVWCDWSAVRDARSVEGALSDAFGLTGQTSADTRGSLRRGIGRRHLLVVTDNCEHILDEAADLLDHLVSSCPHLTVVATSRAPLDVPGEVLCALDPLSCDAAGDGDEWSPAAELFIERARAARRGIDVDGRRELVDSLCRSLDGLPLALELAAAALRRATLEEVAAGAVRHANAAGRRQRGRSDRHQTLRDAVAWSYDLLEPDAQQLFTRAALFAGSFDADDVIGLLGYLDEPSDRVDELLADLVDHSMVVADHAGDRVRYSLLETLRSFATEMLGPTVEHLRTAHTAWVRDLIHRLDLELQGPDEVQAVVEFDHHFAELRVAHAHARRTGDLDTAIDLVVCTEYYALYRLRDEAVAWGMALLDDQDIIGHDRHPEVLGCVAQGLTYRGELDQARALAERALSLCGDDDPRALWALRALSNVDLYEGRLDEATEIANREKHIPGHDDDLASLYAGVIEVLGLAYSGRLEEGRALAERRLERAQELGNITQLAWGHFILAETLIDDPESALSHLFEARGFAISLDSAFVAGVVSVAIGSNQLRLGRVDDALATFAETIAAWRRRGDWTHQWTTLRHVVGLLADTGHPTEAARLLGAVRNPPTGARPYGADDALLEDHAARLADVLGEERFAALEDEGRVADPDAIVGDVCATIRQVQEARARASA